MGGGSRCFIVLMTSLDGEQTRRRTGQSMTEHDSSRRLGLGTAAAVGRNARTGSSLRSVSQGIFLVASSRSTTARPTLPNSAHCWSWHEGNDTKGCKIDEESPTHACMAKASVRPSISSYILLPSLPRQLASYIHSHSHHLPSSIPVPSSLSSIHPPITRVR